MESLLDRFCRYVRIETTAVEETTAYPSSPGQLELGKLLLQELRAMGLQEADQDENGIVIATIPGRIPEAPVVAFFAHLDTSPESSGRNVRPIVRRDYDGGDISLGDSGKVIKVAETSGLAELKGRTLITTDGTTLLGADDKAGVAVIMEAAERILASPDLPHGEIRIVFTCDEEVGRGVDKVDLKKVNARVAYTVDGEASGIIQNETFSADLANVTITGQNIHPGLARGKMVNAVRLGAQFISRMPWHRLAPETAGAREGFLHPYVLEGGVAECRIRILLRSFVTADLAEQAGILRSIAAGIMAEHPRAEVKVEVKEQYRNMIEHLEKEPRAVRLAEEAMRRRGMVPRFESVRGGTDGSRLSEKGLPTPNLATGMHNFHSPLEFACLEEMEGAVEVVMELARLWGKER